MRKEDHQNKCPCIMNSLLFSYDKLKHKMEKNSFIFLVFNRNPSIWNFFFTHFDQLSWKDCQEELLPSKCHSWGISGEVISAQHRFILFFSRSAFHQTIQLDRALRIKVQSFIGLAPAFCDRNLGTTKLHSHFTIISSKQLLWIWNEIYVVIVPNLLQLNEYETASNFIQLSQD